MSPTSTRALDPDLRPAPDHIRRGRAATSPDGPSAPIRRWASDRALCYTTDYHLKTARARLGAAIAGGARRPAEVEALRRQADRLDRIAARFRATASGSEYRFAPDSCDAPRRGLDAALADHAEALARRLDDPDALTGLPALLDADLSELARLVDARAPLSGDDSRSPRAALSRAFEEDLEALRQVDRAIRQLGRCIEEARDDPPLREFWRGARRDFEDEAHRLALRIGEEAIRLDGIEA